MIVDARTALDEALKALDRLNPAEGKSLMLEKWLRAPEENLEPTKQAIKKCLNDDINPALLLTTGCTGIAAEEFYSKQLCHYVPRTPETAAALRVVQDWTPDQKGLMLHGPVGTGKTHLVKGLLMKWGDGKLTVKFTSVASLLDVLRDAGTSGGRVHDVISMFSAPRILALDDFGAEKVTDWAQEKILAVIDARLRHARPTMITSNLDSKHLKETYDIRILDRFKELVRFIHVPGESFRNEIYRRKL
jgi:DNA replication protein DnaC